MQNQIVWVDIPVVDLDRSIAFYSAVLGAAVTKETYPGHSYGLLPHAESNVSGCLVPGHGNAPSQTGPLIYLNATGRLDAAIAAVEPHGGKILEPKHAIGEHGLVAIVLDSEGNRIGLHAPTA